MITDYNNRKLVPVTEIIILCVSILMHYSSFISFKIFSASALLFIPLSVTAALFCESIYSIPFAFFAGVLADVFAGGTVCFNTVILTVFGILLGIASDNYVNRNVRSALTLSLICSFIYFIAKWFIFELLTGVSGKMLLLLTVYMPSAVFTAVFSVPLFYVRVFINKKFHGDDEK